MGNLTIRTRLIATLALLIGALLLVGAIGLRGISRTNEGLRTVYEDRTVALGDLGFVDQDMRELAAEFVFASLHDPDLAGRTTHDQSHPASDHLATIDARLETSGRGWKKYLATYLTPEEKKLAEAYDAARSRLIEQGISRGRDLLRDGKLHELGEVVEKVILPQEKVARDGMRKLVQLQIDVAEQEYKDASERFRSTRLLSIVLLLVATASGLISGVLLLRAIVRPLLGAVTLAEQIAGGDLRGRVEPASRDEVGRMVGALQEMQTQLLRVVRQVQGATGSISSAAQEISAGNQNLSMRTEQQASSLEETASAMEQMTSTVRQNSDSARHANTLVEGTRDQAQKGGTVVGQAITAMSEVSEASRKITAIIGVIDEIAFQTNLLALNAAVEAARAGEQGRGFAVVAAEVRNLAQRSAGAAKEIKGLIQDTVGKVEAGAELVNRTGASLEAIVHDVKQVATIVAEIAAASQEQSTGIDEVGKAVMQMDEMTQQNAALVEEAAAAAEEMEGQARTLEEMMAFFKLDSDPAAAPPAAARSAARTAPAPRAAQAPRAQLKPPPVAARARPAVQRLKSPPAAASRTEGAQEEQGWEEF